MACMLYACENGRDKRIGKFKNREAAEKYWKFYAYRIRMTEGRHPQPIYVETGKGRGKR